MKIPNELRAALKCAYNANERRISATHQSEWQRKKDAAEKLAKSHPNGKKAAKLYAKGQALQQEAQTLFYAIGLDADGDSIRDEKAFQKAGGLLPDQTQRGRWNYDAEVARLAGMSEKAGLAHLKTLGIDWS